MSKRTTREQWPAHLPTAQFLGDGRAEHDDSAGLSVAWIACHPVGCDNPRQFQESLKIMAHRLYLWREERDTGLSPAEIQRRLDADEEVDGLADLSIKDMIDRLKRDFSGCRETAGQLAWTSGEERFRATWTWQFMRLESEHLSDEHRDRFFELGRSFGCPVFDPQMNLKMQ